MDCWLIYMHDDDDDDDDDEKDNEDGEEPLKDGKMTVHIEHKDGTKSDHEYEGLKELKNSIDKFFDSEEKEWDSNPEEEEEAHKGDFDEEDENSNPFSDMIKKMK